MDRALTHPVKKPLTWAFGLIIGLFVLTGVSSYIGLNSVASLGLTIHEHPLKVSNAGLQASLGVAKMHRDMKDVVLAEDPIAMERAIQLVSAEEMKVLENLEIVRARILGPGGGAIEQEARAMLLAWRPIRDEVIQLLREGKKKEAIHITQGKGADHEFRLEEQLVKLAAYANEKADGFVGESTKVKQRYTVFNTLFVVLGALLSILIASLATRQIISSFTLRRRAEEQLDRLIEEAPFGTLVGRFDGQFLRANKELCLMLGYSEKELLNKNARDISHPEDLDLTKVSMEQLVGGEINSFEVEKRFLHKSGKVIWGLLKCGALRGVSVEDIQIISQVQDITEHREHEEILRLQGDIINRMTEGVSLFQPDGTIVYSNPRFEEMFGYKEGEMLGKHVSILNHPDAKDPREKANYILNVLAEEGCWKDEIQNIKKDGTSFWSNSSVAVFEHSKYGQAMVVVQSDITQRKNSEAEKTSLESQLLQARKMEAIGTLSGGIAHDFNNILSAILGYAEMVDDETPAHSKTKNDIGEVLKAGKRAKELVRHILAFSRKSDQALVPVPLHQVTKEAIQLLRASIPATIEINHQIDYSCGTVLADATQIHQVVMNLCTNAAQAMDEKGGRLDLTLSCVALSAGDLQHEPSLLPGSYIKLIVQDDGPGISPEHLDLVFDPYFTTKGVGKGTGMGLAVVHGIVKSLGGMIAVSSTLGQGASFSMYLPEIKEKSATVSVENITLPTGNERILIVDDEVSVMEVTRRMLARLEYQVTGETDSQAALALIQSEPDAFDLIISDQTMPNLTGDELAQKIMAVRRDLPVIICSGYSSKMNDEKAYIAGISAYLLKPVESSVLATTVREVLDGA